jgi:trimeric autotransporter adhesin
VNKLTTVAAVWALAPYMSSLSSIGSSASDATAMADALHACLVLCEHFDRYRAGAECACGHDRACCTDRHAVGLLASCGDTAGGVAGDGSTCGTLFAAETPVGETAPTNVIGAGRNIASNPTANIAGLFALVAAAASYQPTLEGAPASLALGLSPMSGLSLSSGVLTFPSATVGVASAPLSVTVTNTGASAITLSGTSFSGVEASDFSVTAGCSTTLAVGRSVRCRWGSLPQLPERGMRL